MKNNASDFRVSPLLVTFTAVVLLMSVAAVARTTVLFEPSPAIVPLNSSNTYLVHRLTRGDLFGQPRPRPMPAARRPAAVYSDSYDYFRWGEPQEFAPARLDGILMDDARLLAQIHSTV